MVQMALVAEERATRALMVAKEQRPCKTQLSTPTYARGNFVCELPLVEKPILNDLSKKTINVNNDQIIVNIYNFLRQVI